MKSIHNIFIFFITIITCNCSTSKIAATPFNFNEITFHSSPCNGPCPDISLTINSDSSVNLIRTIYLAKGVEDTVRSGGFKGKLDAKNYKQLITHLSEINWETIDFPNITCCDKPVIQILLTYDNKLHKYKSMTPTASAQKLIDFLTQLSTNIQLPRYNKPIDFESY